MRQVGTLGIAVHATNRHLTISGYSDDGDQDSEAMPITSITCSELMAIRSERSPAGLLHPALRWFKSSSKYPI